jgi:uncharacterized protein
VTADEKTARRMRALLLLLFLSSVPLGWAVLTACSRTPAEPSPSATTSTAVTPANAKANAGAARCISPLASAAPEIPAPAGAACPVDPEMGGPKLPEVEVAFPDTEGAPVVTAELAKTPHDIERGLMYRRAMADAHGMLFRLSSRRVHTFWMRNTCIPLDMMFIEDDGTIAGIVEAARPLDETTRSVPCPTSWVLEVNAGFSRKHGVRPGQKITIPASAR